MTFNWINEKTREFMGRGYVEDNSKQGIINRANHIVDIAEKHFKKKLPSLREGIAKGWVSFSSPVWTNYGKKSGLPISCNGSYIEDTTASIFDAVAEIGIMTKNGAGTSCYMGDLRPNGSKISVGGHSRGPVSFAGLVQETIQAISQGNTRRGNCAIWLDVEHPDIEEWLTMRSITDGIHHHVQHLSFGVCISDKWIKEMLEEEKGGSKRKLIVKIINKRRSTGYPYIFFTDNANKNKPDILKDKDIKIKFSNLCSEIMLPANTQESFVCNLSSVNLLHYDEWKNTQLVTDMIFFLDAVLDEYIVKTKNIKYMHRACEFAKKWRAIGLGTLGYHSYLQSKNIPFESEEARKLNIEIHKGIQEKSYNASKLLAQTYGEPKALKGYGRRNLCLNAIAPTTSSSIILGQISPSIEPWESNYFENDNAKTLFSQRNPFLKKILEKLDKNTPEVWLSILQHGGSVQHLEFLEPHQKEVFKTFLEINPKEIIQQAGDRQKYIDQGQSLNLKIHNTYSKKENVDLILLAWKVGLKSLYYHKGINAAQELARANACQSCEA